MPAPRGESSRRTNGSKMRSRHSAGMPGPSSVIARNARSRLAPAVDVDRPVERRVLRRVLEQVAKQPAQLVGVGKGEQRSARGSRSASLCRRKIGASSRAVSSTVAARSSAMTGAGVGRENAQAGEDRVDRLVEPLDLLERRAAPMCRVGGLRIDCVAPSRRAAEQLDVCPDDGQRRSQRVGHDRDQVGACLVDGAQALDLRLCLALQPVALDDAGQQAASVSRNETSRLVNSRRRTVWTLSTPTTCVVPDERHGAHRREARLVDAAHPVKALVAVDVELVAGLRVCATVPVMPTPSGRRATLICSGSRPLVAASVTPVPSRSIRYSEQTSACAAAVARSTIVPISSSHVRADPTSRATSARNSSSGSRRPSASGCARLAERWCRGRHPLVAIVGSPGMTADRYRRRPATRACPARHPG